MPTREIRFQPLPWEFGGPRLLGDIFGLDQAHEIQQSAAAEIITNHVSSGTDPYRHDLCHEIVGQLTGGKRQAPSGIAGVRGVVCARDLGSHRRFNTVSADQEISCGSGTVREEQLDAGGIFFEADDSAVQPNDILIEPSCLSSEQIVKVSAVKLIIWRSVQPLMLIG